VLNFACEREGKKRKKVRVGGEENEKIIGV